MYHRKPKSAIFIDKTQNVYAPARQSYAFVNTSDFLCEACGIISILPCERELLIILISSWERDLLKYYVDIAMERETTYELMIATHIPPPPAFPTLQLLIKSCEYRKQKST